MLRPLLIGASTLKSLAPDLQIERRTDLPGPGPIHSFGRTEDKTVWPGRPVPHH